LADGSRRTDLGGPEGPPYRCHDFPIVTHRAVPPGDGGIALGQAVIADAISR
jgi:hypothetical protein